MQSSNLSFRPASWGGAAQKPAPKAGAQSAPLTYRTPVLRSHGALRDVSSAKSTDLVIIEQSDMHAKENIVRVIWG
jgi:hypothetical protein